MAVVLVRLEIEHVSEFRMNIYKMEDIDAGWIRLGYALGLDLGLQTTLDGHIFLQVATVDQATRVNLNQITSFYFLEKLLECEGYYTFEGETSSTINEKTDICEGIYVNMKDKLDELWALRETMLYWLSYGG